MNDIKYNTLTFQERWILAQDKQMFIDRGESYLIDLDLYLLDLIKEEEESECGGSQSPETGYKIIIIFHNPYKIKMIKQFNDIKKKLINDARICAEKRYEYKIYR